MSVIIPDSVRIVPASRARPGDEVYVNGVLYQPGEDYEFVDRRLAIRGLTPDDKVDVVRTGPTVLEEMRASLEEAAEKKE